MGFLEKALAPLAKAPQGIAGGLAAGQAAVLSQRNHEQDRGLRELQLALQQQALKQKGEQAGADEIAGYRQTLMRSEATLAEKLSTDPSILAKLEQAGALSHFMAHRKRVRAVLENPNATAADFSAVVSDFPELHGGDAGTVEPGQVSTPPPSVTIPGKPTLDIPPELQKLGLQPSPQDEGQTFIFGKPKAAPTLGPLFKLPAEEQAKLEYTRAQVGHLAAETEGQRLGNRKQGLELPYVERRTIADLDRTRAGAALSRAQAAAAPANVRERERHNRAVEKVQQQNSETQAQAAQALARYRELQGDLTSEKGNLVELQIRRLADELPKEQQERLKVLMRANFGRDTFGNAYRPDAGYQQDLEDLLGEIAAGRAQRAAAAPTTAKTPDLSTLGSKEEIDTVSAALAKGKLDQLLKSLTPKAQAKVKRIADALKARKKGKK